MSKKVAKQQVFAASKVTPEALQTVLWETLNKARSKKVSPAQANVIINAAKEICNVARIDLQYKVLNGDFTPKQGQLT